MKKNIFKIIAMLCMVSMLTACGTPNSNDTPDTIVDEPIVDTTADVVVDEPIVDTVDVVDEPIVDTTVESVKYVGMELSSWPKNNGMIYGFVREDKKIDFLIFEASLDVDGDTANVHECFEGVSFTSTLDVNNIKIAEINDVIGVTDNTYDLVVWYAPTEAEAIAVDVDVFGDGRYQSIGSGNFVIAFTSNITEEEAQTVLDSCVYYDNGDATLTQLEAMDALVVEE